jgi:DNA polymerase-3 subunit delta
LLKLVGNMPDYSFLILVTTDKADKRRKIYKAVEQSGVVVELSPLKAKDVRPWITAKLAAMGRKMLPDAQEHLLTTVSMMPQISLGFLDREIEKVALYTGQGTITRKDLVEIMSAVPEVSVFTMIEAVSQKQLGKALKLLEEQLAAGENAIRLLAILARQVRMLWRGRALADRGLNGGQVAEQLGVPPFVGDKLVRQSQSFTAKRLQDTIVMLAEADRDLKSGRADTFVLEKIIISMCQ